MKIFLLIIFILSQNSIKKLNCNENQINELVHIPSDETNEEPSPNERRLFTKDISK